MAEMKGTDLKVKVSTDNITFYDVLGLKDASMSFKGDNQDITTFGKDYVVRQQALKDVTYSLSGFLDTEDFTGQNAIREALVNDTILYFQYLADGATGYQQVVKPSTFDVSDSVDGVSEVSIELEGHDTITEIT